MVRFAQDTASSTLRQGRSQRSKVKLFNYIPMNTLTLLKNIWMSQKSEKLRTYVTCKTEAQFQCLKSQPGVKGYVSLRGLRYCNISCFRWKKTSKIQALLNSKFALFNIVHVTKVQKIGMYVWWRLSHILFLKFGILKFGIVHVALTSGPFKWRS